MYTYSPYPQPNREAQPTHLANGDKTLCRRKIGEDWERCDTIPDGRTLCKHCAVQKKLADPSEFTIVWNDSDSLCEAAKRLGMSRVAATQKAASLRRKGSDVKHMRTYKTGELVQHDHDLLRELAERHEYIDELAAEYDRGTAHAIRLTLMNTLRLPDRLPRNLDNTHCPECWSIHQQSWIMRLREESADLMLCDLCDKEYDVRYTLNYSPEKLAKARRKTPDQAEQARLVRMTMAEYERVCKDALDNDLIPRKRYTDEEFAKVFNNTPGNPYKAVEREFGLTAAASPSIASRIRKRKPKLLKPRERSTERRGARKYDYNDVAKIYREATGSGVRAVANHYDITYNNASQLVRKLRDLNYIGGDNDSRR